MIWIKRNIVIILVVILSLGAFLFSGYAVYNQPTQIDSYVQKHKAEFKGDQGIQGKVGKTGKTGKTGTQGAQGWTGTAGTAGLAGAAGAAGNDGCTWLGWSDFYPYQDLGFSC